MKITAISKPVFTPVVITIEVQTQDERITLVNACDRILNVATGVYAQELARQLLAALRAEGAR